MKRDIGVWTYMAAYWWQIIFAIVVITSFFFYLGLFSIPTFADEFCLFSTQLHCTHVELTDESITVELHNNGKDMKVQQVDFRLDKNTHLCSTGSIDIIIPSGESVAITAPITETCNFENANQKEIEVIVKFTWLDSPLAHLIEGKLLAKKASGSIKQPS